MNCVTSGWLCVVVMLAGAIAEARADDAKWPAELQRWLQPQEWVRDSEQPVVSLGKPGEFDDTHIFAPCVQRDGDLFRLWYCGSRGKVSQRVFELGFALSRDGKSFEKTADKPAFRFGDVNPNETWIVSSEMAFPKNRQDEPNRVRLAKLFWTPPN